VEFVARGDFGLGSGLRPDGSYDHVWYEEQIAPDEVTFEHDVYLLRKEKAKLLKGETKPGPAPTSPLPGPEAGPAPSPGTIPQPEPEPTPGPQITTLRVSGTLPPEVWNRLGTKLLPKLRTGTDLKVGVEFSCTLDAALAQGLAAEIREILTDLGLADRLRIEEVPRENKP
jgi:hypothetical protein